MGGLANDLGKTNQERSELSDKRMLKAAVELILEKGTEKTTLKEVGEKAGYSRGLAGYRFGSKSGLFQFVLHALGDYWLQDLTKVTKNKVGMDAITAATRKHYELFEKNTDNVKTFYILWFKVVDIDESVRESVYKINRRRQLDLTQWIECDPSLEKIHDKAVTIATHYNDALNGTIYNWLLDTKDLSALKKSHEDLLDMMKLLLNKSS